MSTSQPGQSADVTWHKPLYYRVLWIEPNGIGFGERVNIAVVVFGDGNPPRWAWLNDWDRVRAFTGWTEHPDERFVEIVQGYVDHLADLNDLQRFTFQPHYMSCVHLTEPLGTIVNDPNLTASGILFGYRKTPEEYVAALAESRAEATR